MILVDTTVWIDYFNDWTTPETTGLVRLSARRKLSWTTSCWLQHCKVFEVIKISKRRDML
jgi:hypothetical protein